MRVVFMGTPGFALPSLRILLENSFEVVAVVTVPDKPSGRGQHLNTSAVKQFSVERGLTLLQPESLKDPAFITRLKDLQPDLFVVVAFRILPPEVFTIPRLGAFNLHASLLPKYRGAAPINWAIIRGERETGVTTFFLRETVDTGSVILQARLPIGPEETAGELSARLAEVGAEIVLHTVRLIETGKASGSAQEEALASAAPKIFKEDCRIDWTKRPEEVHNFIRGLSPRPAATTTLRGGSMKIYRSRIAGAGSSRTPGEVLHSDRRLTVQAGSGAIEILELQQEGKKKLSAEEFLRGTRIAVGERFQ